MKRPSKIDETFDDIEYWTVYYDVGALTMKFCVTNETRALLKHAFERAKGRDATVTGDLALHITFSDIGGARAEVPRRGYLASVQSTPATRERHAKIEHALRKHTQADIGFDDDND